jgi:tRNA uridine 5-carbamoylmethylation protein Kti12
VQIINSHHSSLDDASEPTTPVEANPSLRDEIYNSASQEKTARAEEFSAIKRALAKDNIVIADGLNYIKGYRYQLWCEAKATATRCCVVHIGAQEDECKKWNRERLRVWGRDGADETDLTATKQAPGTQGTNVLGDLAPESHTAVYGDRVVEKVTRSRSSSLDGTNDSGDEDRKPKIPDDSMTLKSLYISDKANGTSNVERTTPPISQVAESHPQTTTTAGSDVLLPSPASTPPYSPGTLSSLIMRYEPPSPFSRWDTPLFTIPSSDRSPPTDQIWAAMYPTPTRPTSKKALAQLSSSQRDIKVSGEAGNLDNLQAGAATEARQRGENQEAVKPHAATVLPKATTSDALQVLESATMDVVKYLLSSARDAGLTGGAAGGGGNLTFTIPLPPPDEHSPIEATIYIPASTILSQPLLQRLRRKYTQIQRGGIAHGQGYVSGRRAVVEGFVRFLDDEWNNSED